MMFVFTSRDTFIGKKKKKKAKQSNNLVTMAVAVKTGFLFQQNSCLILRVSSFEKRKKKNPSSNV